MFSFRHSIFLKGVAVRSLMVNAMSSEVISKVIVEKLSIIVTSKNFELG